MTILHQKALKLLHSVAVEWFMKAIQEQGNCQMKSDWWAICYWLEKKKTQTQQNISKGQNSAWHWKDALLSYLIWKSTWEFEEGWAAFLWGEGFAVWLLFHCPREDKVRGQRGEERRTSFWFHAAGGWGRRKVVGPWKWSREAGVLLHLWRLSGILHAFIKQDNLPVSLWHCHLLLLGCFGGSLIPVEIHYFIKYTGWTPQLLYVVSWLLFVFSVYLAQLLCLAPFWLQGETWPLCPKLDVLMVQSCSHQNGDSCCWLRIRRIGSWGCTPFLSVEFEYQTSS